MKADLLPEKARYRDDGCHLYPSCLDCPRPQCFYDEGPGRRGREKEERNREVVHLFQRGEKAGAIAHRFKLSERTVYRIVKGRRGCQS